MTAEALLARCRALVVGARGDMARAARALRTRRAARVLVAVVVFPWLLVGGALAAVYGWATDELAVDSPTMPRIVDVSPCSPSWAGQRRSCPWGEATTGEGVALPEIQEGPRP